MLPCKAIVWLVVKTLHVHSYIRTYASTLVVLDLLPATDEDNRMVVETFGNYFRVWLVKFGN